MAQSITSVVQKLRKNFATHVTRDVKYRLKQLSALQRMLDQHEDLFIEALQQDLNKHAFETKSCEIILVQNEIREAKQNLHKWAAPQPLAKNLVSMFDTLYTKAEPYGIALIISAWNYPLFLGLRPLVGAISAGNCAILKPSELAPNIAKVLQDLLPRYLDSNCYEVVQGGPEETQALLEERFDKIFYTGNPKIGSLVYQLAAKHLTPVTLELGGKSPLYFADDSVRSLDVLIQRLLFGKMTNLGQTCVAPDYILCSERIQKLLIERIPILLEKEYGSDMKSNKMLSRIINERHTMRLKNLIDACRDKIIYGGSVSIEERWVHPTIFANCKQEDAVMQEELFGPLIPIMVVDNEDEAIDYINRNEKPLALYVFSDNSQIQRKFIDRTSSGTCVINDTVFYLAIQSIPFGGVGNSGLGCYSGHKSFEAFSHQKPVLNHSKNFTVLFLENTIKYGEKTKSKMMLSAELLKYRQYPLPSLFGTLTFFFGILTGFLLFFGKEKLRN